MDFILPSHLTKMHVSIASFQDIPLRSVLEWAADQFNTYGGEETRLTVGTIASGAAEPITLTIFHKSLAELISEAIGMLGEDDLAWGTMNNKLIVLRKGPEND